MTDKAPKKIDTEYLKRAAMFHLQKFDTTSEGLRKVLERRVYKRCYGTDRSPDDYQDMVSEAVQYCLDRNYVDDDRYTERYIERAQEKGESRRSVIYKLNSLGIHEDAVADALHSGDFSEEKAALSFARKKKIGMFRKSEQDMFRQKDMAAMARKGFSYDICLKITEGNIDDGDF